MPQQPALFMVMIVVIMHAMSMAMIARHAVSVAMVVRHPLNAGMFCMRAMSMTVVIMHDASKAISTAMIVVPVGMRVRSMIVRGRGVCMQLVVIMNVVVGH